MKSRRLFAFVAVLAVLWGALWPLVSTAMPKSTVSIVVCTQSGVQQHIEIPLGGHEVKFHCPLCVATTDVAMPYVPVANVWIASQPQRIVAPAPAVFRPQSSAQPPPSRGPPALP